jgi:hypothetical protein
MGGQYQGVQTAKESSYGCIMLRTCQVYRRATQGTSGRGAGLMPRRWVEEMMWTGTAARRLLVGRGAWQPGWKESNDVAPRL